jgi:hypothetical protein
VIVDERAFWELVESTRAEMTPALAEKFGRR